MKVTVDDDRCQGHTVCNMHAPEVFGLRDEDGHAFVLTPVVPPEHEAVARRAAMNCPEMAISITDEEG